MGRKQKLSAWTSNEQAEQLKQLAERLGVPLADVMRSGWDRELRAQSSDQPRPIEPEPAAESGKPAEPNDTKESD